MTTTLLSIIMPCYNEAKGVGRTLDALEQLRVRLAAQLVRIEIIAVDDGSRDGTADRLDERAQSMSGLKVVRHDVNRGKGAAIRTGRDHVTGQLVVFQDADMETGYKAFTAEAFRVMRMTSDRFGMEPETVARLAQMRARVYEVPISYVGRTYAEGKKITWRDGVAVFWHIVKARASAKEQPRLRGAQ